MFFMLFYISLQMSHAQIFVEKIYTDHQGFYESVADDKKYTTSSHNVLGFTLNNITYSTGVNDSLFIANIPQQQIIFQVFKSLPTERLKPPVYGEGKSAINDIGLSVHPDSLENYSGYKKSDFRKYMADGKNGLDIGTGVFNISLENGEVYFDNVTVDSASIGDGIPDILITQIGNASNSNFDTYVFRDQSNQQIGIDYQVKFNNSNIMYYTMFYFYRLDFRLDTTTNTRTLNEEGELTLNTNSNINKNLPRPVTLMALDWSDLGINKTNYHKIYAFVQLFSGSSDTAFIAYNQTSLKFLRTVSGTVTVSDKATLDQSPFANVDLTLYRIGADNIEHTIGTAKTNTQGYYEFKNVVSNNPDELYRVKIMNFDNYNPKYFIVNNKNGTTLDYLDMTLEEEDSNDNHFVMGKFCVGDWTYNDENTSTGNLNLSTIGISSKEQIIENWPQNIPYSQLALESSTNGLVLSRIDAREIPQDELVEGMIIYDIVDNCLKLYDGTTWDCIQRDCYQLVFDQSKPVFPSAN